MRKKILFALFIFFCISNQNTFALELQVNTTNETCTGNGTLTFVISDFDSNAPVFYSVYLLPNTTTPLATVSTNTLNGLEAGNYLVIASQTVNGVESTVSQNATILDATVPLTFSITGTNVICGSDGVITVNASSTAVSYQILAGPITTAPQSSNVFTGLQAGTYNIRVVDNCDGIVQTFTLVTTTTSLQILQPNFLDVLSCNLISVFHNINSGTASQIAYPLTVQTTVNPPSGSPIVSTQVISSGNIINLNIPSQNDQSYPYNILITDNCGNTYSLNNNIIDFELIGVSGPSINDSGQLSSCTSFDVLHTLLLDVNHQFLYPITVQTTINPPTGPSIVTTQTITSGTSINLNIPMEDNESYSYDLLITDACGNVVTLNDNVIEAPFDIDAIVGIAGCDDNFVNISLVNYLPPFNVNFISGPAGFNPIDYNTNYPGPFNGGGVSFGGLNNSLPEGVYVVEVTDSCGNTSQQVFVVEEPQATVVESSSTPSDCGEETGSILLYFTPFKEITTINLTAAPTSYASPLPQDVSSFVTPNNILSMEDLPAGSYSFDLTDACGISYSHTVVVGGTSGNILFGYRPGCEIGYSSIRISVASSVITFIEIIEAPPSFGFSLPYDISANIAINGVLYMNSLPEGFYKFRLIDECGADRILERNVLGLYIDNTDIIITEECNYFELDLAYISNANNQSYWLQKYNDLSGVWEHPSTGFDYVPGTNLSNLNAVQLTNNSNNINLAYSGSFRIVMSFRIFSNGLEPLSTCTLVLEEFEISTVPKIIEVLSFPCQNNTQEVRVIATGVPPLKYSIIEKNGLPFIIDNGTSNTFSGLEPAIYNFRVEDDCQSFVTASYEVTLLPQPSIIASGLCDGNDGQLQIQDFSFVNYQWYNVQNPSVILSTSNTLQFSPFNSSVDVGTYALQLSTTNANSCVNQTIQYTINPSGFNPNAGEDNSVSLCREDQQIGLSTFLTNPHDNGGVWTDSNGDLVNAIINPLDFSAGVYEFTYTVNGFCSIADSASIEITIKDLPATPVLTIPNPICRGDVVQLNADLVTNATYFWTGPNGFTSTEQNPVIQDFNANNDGSYFVYITVDDCNSATEEVVVNSNPLPYFSIDGATSLCIGLNETLTINSLNFDVTLASISWYFNDILLSTETSSNLQINQIGTYKAIININGCSSEREIEVIEKVNSFEVVLEQGCNGNEYEIKVINAADFPNATYSWTGPNGFVSFSQNIIVPNLQLGTYNVEVEDALGCKSSNFVEVQNTNCFIPNGFSPDDDGINDYFDLTGYGVKKIYIYNRYGRLIYDKDNYINEWKGQTNDNQRVPAASYFYVLEFNEGENKTGWVYVSY